MRQQATPHTATNHDGPGCDNAAPAPSAAGPPQLAEEVFRTGSSITVLVAPAGRGKTTLLRTYRTDSASRWLDDEADATMPVLVNAAALATRDLLPAALAKSATSEFKPHALLDEFTPELFRHPPRLKRPWLVLVDGLDEIPETARRAVIHRLIKTAGHHPALYRFVIATRPLSAGELDVLGPEVPRFELQPFTPEDLRGYARRWFHTLDDPDRHVRTFTALLDRSRLSTLARTPLMAFMLCRLYRANPARPLPSGRTGAYRAFVDLIYEQNTHKDVGSIHDQAISALKRHHQIPRDLKAAEQAADYVRDHLPELIDRLAYERINDDTGPTIALLAALLPVPRPSKVKEPLWNSFLGDLLRPTGLLTQHADDFHFLHQTLREYHAARHATWAQQARTQLLHTLFPPHQITADGGWKPPNLDSSYLGFLLDQLLARQGTAGPTFQRLDELARRGGGQACSFFSAQVRLGTAFPTAQAADWLTRFADDTTLDGNFRVTAAQALATVNEQGGVAKLTGLADSAALAGSDRVAAARALTELDQGPDVYVGHREHGLIRTCGLRVGAVRLARLADDTTLGGADRVTAAEALAAVDEPAGAVRLAHLAGVTTLGGAGRVTAAEALAAVDEPAGAVRLARLAGDADLKGTDRVAAAEALTQMKPRVGAVRLARLADDTTLSGIDRVTAAEALAAVDEPAGAVRLARLAGNTNLEGYLRVDAAQALATVDERAGVAELTCLANNTTLQSTYRVAAAEGLAQVKPRAGAVQLVLLSNYTAALESSGRVDAAEALAWVNPRAGVVQLAHLSSDTAVDGSSAASSNVCLVDRGPRS
ncbi:NACHT domain-containing protein [Streptomyces sp. NPDC059629]|uniref:NACHT domain-containing protein n=1 Tax=Streptomyces sp. NPDC059629 TaxID=3346889 RepID=UPI0036BB50D4